MDLLFVQPSYFTICTHLLATSDRSWFQTHPKFRLSDTKLGFYKKKSRGRAAATRNVKLQLPEAKITRGHKKGKVRYGLSELGARKIEMEQKLLGDLV